ncbi:MAG: ribosome maturation factor RimP [Propionibacteriaceae bacterium]|nr:ribosome maturation factor RimP [Propionibacteriaceae bacterium]
MKEQAIAAIVGPVADQCGLEVDRIEIASAGKRSVLRVYLDGDGPEGRGPSLDEIAEATRALSDALDASDATGSAPYTLEVSSRGVSRPLAEPKHYRRNLGRLVALTLESGSVTGRIASADDTGIELDVDGVVRRVELTDINKAVVKAELRKDSPEVADANDEETE